MKYIAKLIGGPYDGQTREFEGIHKSFEIVERVMEKDGTWRILYTSVYRRKSESPLEFEFVDSN